MRRWQGPGPRPLPPTPCPWSQGPGDRQDTSALPFGPAKLPPSLSAGTAWGQFHTLQAGFSSRSQGQSGDSTSVSDTGSGRRVGVPGEPLWGRP